MVTRINVGPIHPSTHGVLRLVVDVDGDTIQSVEPHVGFLHRGVEKLVENRMYMQSPTYMEKLDYIAPLAYDEAYVAAVEAAQGAEVKERAQYIRVILLELQRVASHLLWLGTLANDIGNFFTLFMWCFRDRDLVLRLLEDVSGSRMFYVNMRIGGLKSDIPAGFEEKTLEVVSYLEKRIPEYEKFLEKNPVFLERMKKVGVLKRDAAIELGVTGPVLRGSGIGWDTRKDKPYYVYDKLHFSPQIRDEGDCFARYKVRMLEIKESLRMVRYAVKLLPGGDAIGLPIKLIMPAAKNRISKVSRETPRGEALMYLVADPQRPYRLAIRAPAFINLFALSELCKGERFADMFAILGSLDVVMADVDR